jgi:hypothetical protein
MAKTTGGFARFDTKNVTWNDQVLVLKPPDPEQYWIYFARLCGCLIIK